MENNIVFLDEIVSLIKQKKELAPLDDSFVREVLLSEQFSVDTKYVTFEKFKRSKLCKDLVSRTRKRLRDMYGLFLDTPLRKKHIEKLSSMDTTALLSFHKSTLERLPYYESIYSLLFDTLDSLGLREKYVLGDFACGYNPLAYAHLPRKPSEYVCCDLSSDDMSILNDFFKKFNLSGRAYAYNVLGTSFERFLATRTFDVCFLFKALDPLEQVKRNSSKKILDTMKSRFIVVSFSLFSIGGKVPIAVSKRSWFEKFCAKRGWEVKTLQIPNELFYIIKKT